MDKDYNGSAWSHKSVLRYYDNNRRNTNDVYPSEWFFLKDKLHENMSVLDIGCAKGFMANVLEENIKNFSYYGVDISQSMIDYSKAKHPQHRFAKVSESDYSLLNNEQFDLVLCIGVLSIHETWRNTLSVAWSHTKKSLIIDLRETHYPSIEDKNISYFKMDFDNLNPEANVHTVPYNIINVSEAQRAIIDTCGSSAKVSHYGYLHPISSLAISPIKKVMANVYCIERIE